MRSGCTFGASGKEKEADPSGSDRHKEACWKLGGSLLAGASAWGGDQALPKFVSSSIGLAGFA